MRKKHGSAIIQARNSSDRHWSLLHGNQDEFGKSPMVPAQAIGRLPIADLGSRDVAEDKRPFFLLPERLSAQP